MRDRVTIKSIARVPRIGIPRPSFAASHSCFCAIRPLEKATSASGEQRSSVSGLRGFDKGLHYRVASLPVSSLRSSRRSGLANGGAMTRTFPLAADRRARKGNRFSISVSERAPPRREFLLTTSHHSSSDRLVGETKRFLEKLPRSRDLVQQTRTRNILRRTVFSLFSFLFFFFS